MLFSKKLSIPLYHGFSPTSWQRSAHLMLKKDREHPHINKLRSIQILDPEYNAILKVKIIRQTMHRQSTIRSLGSDMYGGRPQLSELYALMHQNLTFDWKKLTVAPSSLINLDASKCFDRIYPNLANIALQRIGIHPNIATIFSETAIKMKHQIKTVHGLFPTCFMAPSDKIYSGVGQGNAAAGISWLSIESILLKAYTTHPNTSHIINDPSGKVQHTSAVIGFVDDNNILSTYTTKNKIIIHDDIKQKLLLWSQYLEASCGIINHKKTHVYSWRWSHIGNRIQPSDIISPN